MKTTTKPTIKKTDTITDHQWNGSTFYQINGEGEIFHTYGLASRAMRKAAN